MTVPMFCHHLLSLLLLLSPPLAQGDDQLASQLMWGEVEGEERAWKAKREEGEVEGEERGWQDKREEGETMSGAGVEINGAMSPLDYLDELEAKSVLDRKARTMEELEDRKPRTMGELEELEDRRARTLEDLEARKPKTMEELEDQCKLLLDKFSQSSSDFTRSPPKTQHWQPCWPQGGPQDHQHDAHKAQDAAKTSQYDPPDPQGGYGNLQKIIARSTKLAFPQTWHYETFAMQ